MASIPLPELSLFLATPNQTLESRKRHAPLWRKKLSNDEYLLRDQVMEKQEHALDRKLATW